MAYEAADCGLLSADLAAGILRIKDAKRLGVPAGNWLSAEQDKRLLLFQIIFFILLEEQTTGDICLAL